MRTYVSLHPLDLSELLLDAMWHHEKGDLIADDHGNEAHAEELPDSHVRLTVPDGSDVSELLERHSFEREDEQ